FVRFQTQDDSSGMFGYMELKTTAGRLTAVPVLGSSYLNSLFSYLSEGQGNYTALAVTNPGMQGSTVRIYAYDSRGYVIGSTLITLGPGAHWSRLLRDFAPSIANQIGGSIR